MKPCDRYGIITAVPRFEKVLNDLEVIAEKLEGDQLELDKAVALYGQGMKLIVQAKKELSGAEKKVKQLFLDQGEIKETDFENAN